MITGFLGAGKTTAILHLLQHKPDTERWAVLVNEFGEVGIDGALINGNDNDVAIKEVPGGCMCCTSGVPMQVALNQIIQQAKPDRLLIEPTGLGHPKEVLSVLRGESYKEVLSVGPTICLLDARKLSDKRYAEHETFNQQLLVSDYIIANKSDQYSEVDQALLTEFISSKGWETSKHVKQVEYGQIDPTWLDDEAGCQWLKSQWVFLPISKSAQSGPEHQDQRKIESMVQSSEPMNGEGNIQTYENYSQGFYAYSWVFSTGKIFDLEKLKGVLRTIPAERIKAVVNTDDGWVGLNWIGLNGIGDDSNQEQSEYSIDEYNDGKIEIITDQEIVQSVLTKKFNDQIFKSHH